MGRKEGGRGSAEMPARHKLGERIACLLCRCILCCTAARAMEETSHTAPVPPLVPVPVPGTTFALISADYRYVTVKEELGMVV